MPGGKGILVPHPLESPADLSRLPDGVDVSAKLGHVLAGVRRINERIADEGLGVPLIGFSAAPWTLFFYIVGGSSKRGTEKGMAWLRQHPADSRALLSLLTRVVIDYLAAQAAAGAHMLQLFEAMGEFIAPPEFAAFAQPCIDQIAAELRVRCPGVPLLAFARDAMYALPALQAAGFDVLTLDLSADRRTVRGALAAEAAARGARPAALQGNLDPGLLLPGGEGGAIEAAVRSLFADLGTQGLIANLGAGLGGKEEPAKVSQLVDTVHSVSRELIAAGKK